jgi:hypothetical protein
MFNNNNHLAIKVVTLLNKTKQIIKNKALTTTENVPKIAIIPPKPSKGTATSLPLPMLLTGGKKARNATIIKKQKLNMVVNFAKIFMSCVCFGVKNNKYP